MPWAKKLLDVFQLAASDAFLARGGETVCG